MKLRRLVPLVFAVASLAAAGRPHAKNVVLFLGDAGGIATLHAASVFRYGDSQRLFIQRMPNIGLMDTSTSAEWVSDSAAGMSAIVTGQKTLNGVLSQAPDGIRGEKDGTWLKTILEEAEERGLSTGIVTNMPVTDATPAACYAHVSARSNARDIVAQFLKPRFGDGVDVLIGAPPAGMASTGTSLVDEFRAGLTAAGYALLTGMDDPASASAKKIAVLLPGDQFAVQQAIDVAMGLMKKNPRGYFLMVEWDMHTSRLQRGLERVVELDTAVEKTAAAVGRDTLVIFTADHSYDLRMRGGKKGEPIVVPAVTASEAAASTPTIGAAKPAPPAIRVEDGHTGEQVLVAAQGPGAEAIHGFILNTDLYGVMRRAYGWDTPARPAAKKK